jgi:mono/diheme cytochrome c family protein
MKAFLYLFYTLLLTVSLMFTSGCNARRSMPLRGPLSLEDKQVKKGQVVFMQYCHSCHPHGEGGLGPAINPAPSFGKRFQVRHGLGVMPDFDKDAISSEQLDQLVAYLKVLKRNK